MSIPIVCSLPQDLVLFGFSPDDKNPVKDMNVSCLSYKPFRVFNTRTGMTFEYLKTPCGVI